MSDMNKAEVMEAPYEVPGAEDPAGVKEGKEDGAHAAPDAAPAPDSRQTSGKEARSAAGKENQAGEEAQQEQLLEKVSRASREDAAKTLKQNGLDFAGLEQEYLANGELSEDSYKALEQAGIGKEYVDAYIKGNEAVLQQFVGEVTEMAGGRDQYAAMTQWAAASLPEDEIAAFNAVMASGNKPMIRIAVSGLVARYHDSEGMEPALLQGKASAASRPEGGSFASAAEMIRAMSDPRYGKDPAYTREVERKTGNSTFFA